jgi:hypothetical protein
MFPSQHYNSTKKSNQVAPLKELPYNHTSDFRTLGKLNYYNLLANIDSGGYNNIFLDMS